MLVELILAACTECGRPTFSLMQSVAVVTLRFFRLPGFFFFALIILAAGRLSTTNYYWQSRVCVSLSVTC